MRASTPGCAGRAGAAVRVRLLGAWGVALSALAAAGLFRPAFAQGCAMCGTAINSPNDPLAKGMALSILLMLAVPNLLLASIGGWIFFTYRRAALARVAAQGARAATEDAPVPDSGTPETRLRGIEIGDGPTDNVTRHSKPGEPT